MTPYADHLAPHHTGPAYDDDDGARCGQHSQQSLSSNDQHFSLDTLLAVHCSDPLLGHTTLSASQLPSSLSLL